MDRCNSVIYWRPASSRASHSWCLLAQGRRTSSVRFTTLVALCDALNCQPGDLFAVAPDAENT
ncbi:MAG: helix-turn-helix domain-containing protein [Microbacteriaceae bacterium]